MYRYVIYSRSVYIHVYINKENCLTHKATWMNFKVIILSERRQRKEYRPYDSIYINF